MNNKTIDDIRGLIRPVLTIIFGIAFIFAVFCRLVEPIWLVYLTTGIFVFWFGDRAFKNLGFMLQNHYQVPTPTVAEPAPTPAPVEPKPTEPVSPAPEPIAQPQERFDAAAFHSAVLQDVVPKYTESNPATIFYQARDKGMATKADNTNQVLEYWDYLVGLAHDAFRHIWGCTLQEAVASISDPGCPTCTTCAQGCGSHTDIDSKARHLGMAYYAILLELRRTLGKQQDLYQLAESGIDWKAKLSIPHQTLYYVAELAQEILRTSR